MTKNQTFRRPWCLIICLKHYASFLKTLLSLLKILCVEISYVVIPGGVEALQEFNALRATYLQPQVPTLGRIYQILAQKKDNMQVLTRRVVELETTTGIFGLAVHPHPRPHLIKTYNETLQVLSRLPEHAIYRQAAEALTQHRLSIVEATEDINEIEKGVGAGQIEEVILQAEDEKTLAVKMEEWKPWESLEEQPPAEQWNYDMFKE
ncbi:11681_t:CDS:2 [Ambispora gerdemannii]|uniref:11681_t:CDS:1 n=1 Tax=Ambispora gerdemannii TaxID=144530 RepID=A0A9N8VX58_9GLOM|nr:11681_t:CDS:2 [Ambispora gerdemannii]